MRAGILGLVAGAWLLQCQADLAALGLLLALAASALGGLVALRADNVRSAAGLTVARLLLGALLGFAWAGLAAHVRISDALAPEWEGRDTQVTGVIADLPQPVEQGARFEFEVEQSEPAEAHVPHQLLLSWFNGIAPEEFQEVGALRAGERWRFTVRLKRPHGLANPYGFDYEAWLIERGIRATGYVRPGAEKIDDLVIQPKYLLQRLREKLRERIWDALPGAPYAGVLAALAIGDQRSIDSRQWQLFARTGVSHLMSISGLHVTMIAGLAAWLAFSLWRRSERLALALPAQKAACAAGFIGALAYCLLSGFAVPAQRTLYMVGVVALALWLDRASAPSRVLALALGLVLLLDPWAVLEPGFWLSFSAVAVIFYLGTARPARGGWLRQWGGVQWGITVGLAPLMLVLFRQVSIVSPIANAVAIPLVSFVVTPLAIAGSMLPFDFLLVWAHWSLTIMMPLLERLAQFDAAVWQQHAPVPWTLFFALAGTLWLLAPRGMPARSLGLVLMLPMFFILPERPAKGEAHLSVLDVGQGMAVAVRTRNHTLVYDAGPSWGADTGKDADSGARVVVPYLRALGVDGLDMLVVSHDDGDHAGGAVSVLQSFPDAMLLSALPMRHPAQGLSRIRVPCYAGRSWNWDGVRFSLLHPTAREYANPWTSTNDTSCVLKIEARGGSALLAGDIGRYSEEALVQRLGNELKSDVLLVPHHGSASSSGTQFVQAVAPRHAVFSAGYRNSFGHPRQETLQRYRALGSATERTDLDGAVTVEFESKGLSVQRYREAERRYWNGFAN